MRVMPLEEGSFVNFAIERRIEIVDQLGVLVRKEDRTVKVLDGDLSVGNYSAIYTCGVNAGDIRETDVKDLHSTKLIEPANQYETGKELKEIGVEWEGGYLAAVQVVDKQTDINVFGEEVETIEDYIVVLIGG